MNKNRRNSSWLAAQYLLTLFLSFISLKLNFLQFGEELFGLWIMVISFWGMGNLVDFGFGTAIVKYVSSSHKRGKLSDINSIVVNAGIFFVFFGICLLLFGYLLGYLIILPNVSFLSKDIGESFNNIFILLGISFYFQYIVIFFKSVLEGLTDFVTSSMVSIFQSISTFLAVVLVFIFKLSLFSLSFFYLMNSVIVCLIFLVVLKLKHNWLLIEVSIFDTALIKKMFKFSFSIQIASILGALLDPIAKIIIGNYNSLSMVSYYEVARRFAIAISGLFNTTFKTILPQTSILENISDYKEFIINQAPKYSKFGIIYSAIFYGVLSSIILFIIKLWFGYEQSMIIFLLLGLAESINNFGYVLYTFFIGIGKGIYLIFIQFFNNLIFISSLIIGFSVFHNELGFIGYSISVFLMNSFMLYAIRNISTVSMTDYLRQIPILKFLLLLFTIFSTLIINFIFNVDILILCIFLSILISFIYRKDFYFYLNELKIFQRVLKK